MQYFSMVVSPSVLDDQRAVARAGDVAHVPRQHDRQGGWAQHRGEVRHAQAITQCFFLLRGARKRKKNGAENSAEPCELEPRFEPNSVELAHVTILFTTHLAQVSTHK